MKYSVHHEAQLEYDEILAYLETVSLTAADRFELAFMTALETALKNPFHYHFENRSRRQRRANIKNFNRHFLYTVDEANDLIRITAVRHDHQHPSYGLDRE
jgi:plasmid stabilization system protein ParE